MSEMLERNEANGATFNCGHPRWGSNIQRFKNGNNQSERCKKCSAALALRRGRRLQDIARLSAALIAKLDECEPHIGDAFLHRFLRVGEYTGPTYINELAALRALLSPTEAPAASATGRAADHSGVAGLGGE